MLMCVIVVFIFVDLVILVLGVLDSKLMLIIGGLFVEFRILIYIVVWEIKGWLVLLDVLIIILRILLE